MVENSSLWMITGTGTGVGKTVAAAGLLRAARSLGYAAQIIKAVQTGCERKPDGELAAPDAEVYRHACPEAQSHVLHTFEPPCSPHLAAAMNGVTLRAEDLAANIMKLIPNADVTIVEGAGGILVPLNESETFSDLAVALQGKIIVAADNSLGTVNHTLLTLEALRLRGIPPDALVINQTRPATSSLDRNISTDNPEIISRFGNPPCLATLPHYPNSTADVFDEPVWRDMEKRLAPVARHLFWKNSMDGEMTGRKKVWR